MVVDSAPRPVAVHAAWDRLCQLEREVAELRQLLLSAMADQATPVDDWQVTSLGTFRLCSGGREAPLCASRRGRSILKYLLGSPGYAATASALIDTFWPSASPTSGAHNLQMAVHALRQSLRGWGPGGGDEVVLYRQDVYLLNPRLTIDQDVRRFTADYERGRRAMASGDLEAARQAFELAREAYAGDYLADSPFEEWAEPRRAGLQDTWLSLLGHVSRVYAELADWDRAAESCQQIVVVDPFREDAYRQLMRCHAARGRTAEVRRAYRDCCQRLRRDLGVAPAAETADLYRRLLARGEAAGLGGAEPRWIEPTLSSSRG